MKREQVVLCARREKEVWEDGNKELEKVKQDKKWFEWLWYKRVKEEKRETEDVAEWRMYLESGCMGLKDWREMGAVREEKIQWEAALAECLRPVTLPLPLFSISPFFSFTLCPLTSPLLSLLYLCSKYPGAVNSNRSLNDTSLHWQVLSSRATIGKKDLRKDKIGPTNSDNSKRIMARNPFPMVLHCHLVVGAATGYRISSEGYWSLVTVSYITAMW